ncbi:MAG: thioredoxin-disulfide reductase [Kiritimatiellae bacterium]|nr:thioredoxin-disulfide reductase [Kiritimatiellia bacterium]
MENVVIIGSGPAGLTAAIYAARANLQPVVIDGMQQGGQLTQTTDVENFPGFETPIAGTDLVNTMRKQAERFGVRFLMDEVSACDFSDRVKKVSLMVGGTLEARTVIIATGASARYLGLDSEQQLMGKGVSACATCDGAFFKGQRVAVIGGGDTAMEDALYLSRLAEQVTVVHRRDVFRASKIMADRVLAAPNIDVVWNAVVEEVLDPRKGEVTGIRLKDVVTGNRVERVLQGVFVAIGHTPNTSAFVGQVELDPDGYVVTENTRTSSPGVFAAGDVQDRHYKQAVTAAGTGCMAALEAERFLAANG